MNRVYVVPSKSSKNLLLRWKVPWNNSRGWKWRQRSAKTSRMREAERAAAKLETELEAAALCDRTNWVNLRARFEDEHASLQAKRTLSSYRTALNRFEDFVNPLTNRDINSANLVRFISECNQEEIAPKTISSYVTHLKVFFKWLIEDDLLEKMPKASVPRASKNAKGRPLTVEEFERFLGAVPRLFPDRVAEWRFDCHVLWYSGLRLEEAYELSWDDPVSMSIQGLDRMQPMLWVPENQDKGRAESVTPLTPDFVEYLRDETVPAERRGNVLNFAGNNGGRLTLTTISRKIGELGKLSQLTTGRNHKGESLFATAHDLRRSFATRWASEVEAPILQRLMRHKSIATTLKFYAFVNASKMGDKINSAFRSQEEKRQQEESERE